MSFTLKYQPEAKDDVDHAIFWYEDKRHGLGDEFLDELEAAEAKIIETPYSRKVHEELRRRSLARFQYNIFYLIEETNRIIQVLGVFHHRQNPTRWQQRYTEWFDS